MLDRISVKGDKMFRVNATSYFDRHSQRQVACEMLDPTVIM